MEGGPPTFRQDFSCPALLKDLEKTLPIRGYHPLWPAFPDRSGCFLQATGLVRVRSPLLTESRLMSFPKATEMFQFASFASCTYEFSAGYRLRGGFPHSEIHGSKLVRSSPWLIAAYYVLHRLYTPRHPPNALKTLDRFSNSCHAQEQVPQTQQSFDKLNLMVIHSLASGYGQDQLYDRWSESHLFTMTKEQKAEGCYALWRRRLNNR